jgi:hypothetical protein
VPRQPQIPEPAPPAPTFDPFASEPDTPPPPPSLNPFEKEPKADSIENQNTPAEPSDPATFNPFAEGAPPQESADIDFAPPPPPPAPTFNPFDNDPLPKGADSEDIDPFAKSTKDQNKTKVPLENIFSEPPSENSSQAPESDFNPFDLPQSQDN